MCVSRSTRRSCLVGSPESGRFQRVRPLRLLPGQVTLGPLVAGGGSGAPSRSRAPMWHPCPDGSSIGFDSLSVVGPAFRRRWPGSVPSNLHDWRSRPTSTGRTDCASCARDPSSRQISEPASSPRSSGRGDERRSCRGRAGQAAWSATWPAGHVSYGSAGVTTVSDPGATRRSTCAGQVGVEPSQGRSQHQPGWQSSRVCQW